MGHAFAQDRRLRRLRSTEDGRKRRYHQRGLYYIIHRVIVTHKRSLSCHRLWLLPPFREFYGHARLHVFITRFVIGEKTVGKRVGKEERAVTDGQAQRHVEKEQACVTIVS